MGRIKREKGALLAEWTLIFLLFVFLVLAVGQIAFLLLARQTVDYAAYITARSLLVYQEGQGTPDLKKTAALACLGIAGLVNRSGYRESSDPDILHIAGRYQNDPRSHSDFLLKYSAALDKTRVTANRIQGAGEKVKVNVEVTHDYELDFPIINQLLWKLAGGPARYGYPHISIRSTITLYG